MMKEIRITNGYLEVKALVSEGPRVSHFGFAGEDSVLFGGPGAVVPEVEDVSISGQFGRGDYHFHWAHRLWAAPETIDSYYPDTDPVEVRNLGTNEVIDTDEVSDLGNLGIKLTSAPLANDLVYEIELSFDHADPSKLNVNHRIINMSDRQLEVAPLGVTQLAPGGVLTVPQGSTDPDKLLPDRVVVLWPYTNMGDDRVVWGEHEITIAQKNKEKFKIGTFNREGWASYRNNGSVFSKTWVVRTGARYPDSGCNFEAYTDANILEMETLGELSCLLPGECAEHLEVWRLERA